MITPTLDQARHYAKQGNVIPVYASVLADTETPVSVWLKLFKNTRYSFLLESVVGGEQVARYSFIGGDPYLIFTGNGTNWTTSGLVNERGATDPVAKLRALMAQYKPVGLDSLPRFCGGAVGYFSYDAIRLWEHIPDRHAKDPDLDEIFFGFYRDLIVFDNREHRLLFVSSILPHETTDLLRAYNDACLRIGEMMDRMTVSLGVNPVSIRQRGDMTATMKRPAYEAAVDRCKEYIKAGDIFQVVLSQRFAIDVEGEPFDLYRLLRTVNPSPYMYYLAMGGSSVVGASPEMMVRVEGGNIDYRPIAGTSRRGAGDTEDKALAEKLLADPKERAEHVMLVDLGRNDVGRVAESGSVRVDDMMHIENYSHVMHIVSNVKGKLSRGKDAFDALVSCFPAGTLSGAPKIRAMEIIDELEVCRRGIYGGALGYIDWSGNLDTCIIIRTLLYREGIATIQVGAGIVADSIPSKEFEETMHKGQALFTAIKNAGAIVGG